MALVHPSDRTRMEAETTGFLAAGDSYQHDFCIVRPNGEVRWIHDRGVIERGSNGAALRIRGVNIDMTDQRQAEPVIADRELDLLKLALEAAEQGAWDYDIAADVPVWDDTTYRLFGQPPGESLSYARVVGEIVHPDDRERVDAAARAAMDPAGDGRYVVEHRVVMPSGETRWVSVLGRTVFEGEGAARIAVRMRGITRDVTVRHRQEAALRESEARLATAVKAGRLGVHEFHPKTGKIFWDDTVREIWGVPADETVTYEMFAGGIHPEDLAPTQAAVDAALDPTGPGRYQAVYRVTNRRSGAVRWVRADGDVTFEDGVPVRLVGTAKDITERVGIETRLRESEARLRSVLDQLFAFVGLLSPDGVLLHANGAPLRAADITLEDVVGKRFDETHWWSYDPQVQAALRAAIGRAAAGELVRYDVPVRMQGGRLMTIDFQIAPMRDEAGAVVGLIPSGIDIDQRVAAEAALRESEDRFRAMTDNLPLIVWLHGFEGQQEFVNQTYCDYFGVTREEMREGRWQLLTHPKDGTAYVDEFVASVRERRRFHAEVRVRRGDGEWRWLESFASPRFASNGEYLGHIGTSVDITDRKRQDELRQLLIEELNHRVKNTLAIVQAIAHQSLRSDRSLEEQRTVFEGRLAALAGAHDVLTRESWEKATLSEIVTGARLACGIDEAQFVVGGPQITLQPKQAVSLSLAFHELCTNAMKYGALSAKSGRVSIAWNLSDAGPRHLRILWTEQDGPAITPPSRQGFGTRLLQRTLATELGATVEMDFRPEGLTCTIEATLLTEAEQD